MRLVAVDNEEQPTAAPTTTPQMHVFRNDRWCRVTHVCIRRTTGSAEGPHGGGRISQMGKEVLHSRQTAPRPRLAPPPSLPRLPQPPPTTLIHLLHYQRLRACCRSGRHSSLSNWHNSQQFTGNKTPPRTWPMAARRHPIAPLRQQPYCMSRLPSSGA